MSIDISPASGPQSVCNNTLTMGISPTCPKEYTGKLFGIHGDIYWVNPDTVVTEMVGDLEMIIKVYCN